MNDRVKVVAAGVTGAIVGSLAGYLLLTRRGEEMRHELLPQLEEFLGRIKELQESLVQARSVAVESWQTLQGLTQTEPPSSSRTH